MEIPLPVALDLHDTLQVSYVLCHGHSSDGVGPHVLVVVVAEFANTCSLLVHLWSHTELLLSDVTAFNGDGLHLTDTELEMALVLEGLVSLPVVEEQLTTWFV